ncbi:MAG TPA: hypothetical protein VGQ32_04920 [Thermoanaerobaculia bacterium]|jgi:hypothetical protein|nr:hypothetical protein [Thermoanaerobaculia bacterium]
MRVARFWLFLIAAVCFTGACASARKSGPAVAVYEADVSTPPGARRLPDGCRLLGTSGPVDQMESDRAMDDPYRPQRLETAGKGGNVLLVLSTRTVTRPNIDCPSGDTSPGCLSVSKSWFRLSFEEYACTEEAARALAESKPADQHGGISIPLWTPKPKETPSAALAPPDLKAKLLDMMRAGVSPEVLLAYTKGQSLTRKMTAEEIIDWTKSGIPDAVIETAASSR